MPQSTGRSWLLVPAVAALVTIAGSLILVRIQVDNRLWLAGCAAGVLAGCGLAMLLLCAAAIVIALGIGFGLGRRRSRHPAHCLAVGGVLGVGCLGILLAATAATATVLP